MLREGGDVAGVFQQVFTKRRSLLYRTVGVSSFREPLCCRWCHGLACWSGCGHQRAGRMPSKNCSFSFFRPAQFARKLRFNEVSNIVNQLTRQKKGVWGIRFAFCGSCIPIVFSHILVISCEVPPSNDHRISISQCSKQSASP